MRHARARFALVILAGGLAAGFAPPRADPDECPRADAFGLIARTNSYRAALGLPLLTPDARLFRAAQRLAEDLARQGVIGHVGSDGSTVGVRVAAAGYDRAMAAENVAAGQLEAGEVVLAWVGSPGHRQNLESARVLHAGAAHVTGRPACRGCSPDYWVLVLAVPRRLAPPVPVVCSAPTVAER